jgi:ADP-heptose:LPS heptosyltransferase
MKTLVLGTKNRTLGDSLILTTLPAKLKAAYPHLKIEVFVRGLNPWVFLNHPHIDGWSRAPKVLYGDDTNLGEGHLIQQKERGFGLEVSEEPRPEVYLTLAEIKAAKARIESQRKSKRPLIALHSAGSTEKNVAEAEAWGELVKKLSEKVEVWQIGLEGDRTLPSVTQTAFFPKSGAGVRELFAFFSRIQGFIGVDSGPMHVAKSQGVPSLILTRHSNVHERIDQREREPYYLHQNFRFGFLYRDHTHMPVERILQEPEAALQWWEQNA